MVPGFEGRGNMLVCAVQVEGGMRAHCCARVLVWLCGSSVQYRGSWLGSLQPRVTAGSGCGWQTRDSRVFVVCNTIGADECTASC